MNLTKTKISTNQFKTINMKSNGGSLSPSKFKSYFISNESTKPTTPYNDHTEKNISLINYTGKNSHRQRHKNLTIRKNVNESSTIKSINNELVKNFKLEKNYVSDRNYLKDNCGIIKFTSNQHKKIESSIDKSSRVKGNLMNSDFIKEENRNLFNKKILKGKLFKKISQSIKLKTKYDVSEIIKRRIQYRANKNIGILTQKSPGILDLQSNIYQPKFDNYFTPNELIDKFSKKDQNLFKSDPSFFRLNNSPFTNIKILKNHTLIEQLKLEENNTINLQIKEKIFKNDINANQNVINVKKETVSHRKNLSFNIPKIPILISSNSNHKYKKSVNTNSNINISNILLCEQSIINTSVINSYTDKKKRNLQIGDKFRMKNNSNYVSKISSLENNSKNLKKSIDCKILFQKIKNKKLEDSYFLSEHMNKIKQIYRNKNNF